MLPVMRNAKYNDTQDRLDWWDHIHLLEHHIIDYVTTRKECFDKKVWSQDLPNNTTKY